MFLRTWIKGWRDKAVVVEDGISAGSQDEGMTRHHSSSPRGPRPRLNDTPPRQSSSAPPHPPTLPTPWAARITVDDEENATYTPGETTASVLAHTSIDAPAKVTAETKLPRHQAGQVSIFSSYVELGGFEPPTFSLRTRRATNCAIAPSADRS